MTLNRFRFNCLSEIRDCNLKKEKEKRKRNRCISCIFMNLTRWPVNFFLIHLLIYLLFIMRMRLLLAECITYFFRISGSLLLESAFSCLFFRRSAGRQFLLAELSGTITLIAFQFLHIYATYLFKVRSYVSASIFLQSTEQYACTYFIFTSIVRDNICFYPACHRARFLISHRLACLRA